MKTSRFISLLLCVVMIMSLFTGLAGSASADDVITHEVQSGEILMKICEKYGLNYYNCKNAIMQLNGFTNENQLARLTVGQKLKLPGSNAVAGTVSTTTATVTTTTVGGTTLTTTSYGLGGVVGGGAAFYLTPYTVKAGDTLNKICNELGSNYYYYAPVIQGINALANPNSIYAGQVLLIPTASAAGATSAVVGHVVKAGETMSSIANQYGINYQAQRQLINGLNRRDNMDKIYVGQTVLIPGAATASTGSVVTTATTATTATTTPAAASGAYQISLTAATNGSPYAVVNNTQYASRANAGETVNIVPTPKAGYAVRDIQVVRTDSGTDIPVSNYSFTMPNSSVQVTVFYSRGFVINKVASPYGSFDAMIYGTNANTAFFGDEITLAIYPKNGYNVKFPNETTKITGVYYQKSDLSVARVYVWPDDADGLYKFKMPNYEIRLTVEFEISSYATLRAGTKTGSGSVRFFVNGEQVTRAKKGDVVTMEFVPDSGWAFASTNYEKGGLSELRGYVKDNKVSKVNDTTYRFTVGDNLNIKTGPFTFENHNTYGIGADIRGGHGGVMFQIVDGSKPDYPVLEKNVSRAQPRQLVEVVFVPDNGWAFKDFDYMKTNSRGNWSKYQLAAGQWSLTGTVTNPKRCFFMMPSEDVTLVFKYDKSGETYYDLQLEYDGNVCSAAAFQDGKSVRYAKAGMNVTVKISAKENRRVIGVQWLYEGSGDNVWLSNTNGDTTNKTYEVQFLKHAGWDKIRVWIDEYREYTTVKSSLYTQDTRDGGAPSPRGIELYDVPEDGVRVNVGETITFRAASTRTGFSVNEVWVKRGSDFVKMLAPVSEGSDTYRYTVTSADKEKELRFLAVQVGKEPVHYIIPEYSIADSGIINVSGEPLYTVEYTGITGSPIPRVIGPVYGMGANLPVSDVAIKSDTGVKVKVTIKKDKHEFVGDGTVLIYQVDTLTIRSSDYILNNFKVLENSPDSADFVYEFWYKSDEPLTDLNIMVNFKEIGTRKPTHPAETTKVTSVIIGGKTVTLDDSGKATVVTGDKTTNVTVTTTTTP